MNKFNISDLSIEDVNLIMSGLLELPGKFTMNLLVKVRSQLEEQGLVPSNSQASATSQPPTQAGTLSDITISN